VLGGRGWSARCSAGALALLAPLLALAGCGSGGSSGETSPGRGGTLIDAEDASPAILNPLLPEGATATTQRIASNVLQNLLTTDASGHVVPQLATEVPSGADVRPGPLRVTFRLRPEARWSDGPRVTSADVVFTWHTMMDPRWPIANRSGWDRIRTIRPGRTATGGTCPGATCFTVAFRGDYAPWRDVFNVAGGYYVLPRHVLRRKDFSTVWNDGGLVGSGPFRLSSYRSGVRAVLTADPGYWDRERAGGGPFLDRIVLNFLQGPAAALTALRQGEAQMASVGPDPDAIQRAREVPDTTVQEVPSVFLEHVALDAGEPPFDDVRVRRAFADAIDRDQIAQVLLDGGVPVAQSVLKPFQPGYADSFARYSYDPGAAGHLLEAAGWRRGGDGVFAKDGHELRVPLSFDAGDDLRATTARLMARQAKAAGILIVPTPENQDALYGGLADGTFTASMFAIGGGLDPSLTGLLASDQVPSEGNRFSGQNVYRWTDREADTLMRRSDSQIDPDARAATLRRLSDRVADQVPLLPLYQQPNAVAFTSALHGVDENPTQAEVFWNSAEWSLDPG
jgi:peptide/nickel transport system substrate-binding protein